MPKYIVRVQTGELVGYFEDIEITTEEEISVDDTTFFEELQEVIDVAEELAIEEESARLEHLEEGSEEYEEEVSNGTWWNIVSIERAED